ncbi:MATE family efflux transporter [Aminobacterium sp. MB27-C1]|uniref:MATE family efflux transporter n=1 Tax=unclassified Aminobacterium TaxID=2685012 RepID=UPI001BD07D69|nr:MULTISPECIES: MATE family efflux transporter [unclassified Aminobacterium]MEA4877117.1 MATE family efflux transporter [Aminobacterium sp.]WMI71855.1 MATE family efflux transporter [Aminobacterium sp. MB27-C1]
METTRRMGEESIPRLLFHFSAPAIVGLLANALYNIVDRIFVGHAVGPMGIASIAVAFPFMIAGIAVGLLVGVGSSALISISLGEKKRRQAEVIMGNAVALLAIASVLGVILGWLFLDDILRLGGATDLLLPEARKYLRIILMGVPFSLFSFGFNYFIRAEGSPRFAMMTLLLGAGANIVLDAVMIMGLNMGLEGAAFATITAQLIAALWATSFYARNKGRLRIRLINLRLRKRIVKRIVSIGMAPFLLEATFTFILGLLNQVLKVYGGEIAISALGIFFSLDSMLFLPVLGIGEGAQPIIGYNFGAKHIDRVKSTVKWALAGALSFFGLSFIIVFFLARPLVMIFNTTSPELINLAARGLVISYSCVVFAGITIIASYTFQALGLGRQSLILNIMRQVIFFIPPLLILPPLLGTDGVWLAFPFSDVGGGLFGAFLLRRQFRDFERFRVEEKDNEKI